MHYNTFMSLVSLFSGTDTIDTATVSVRHSLVGSELIDVVSVVLQVVQNVLVVAGRAFAKTVGHGRALAVSVRHSLAVAVAHALVKVGLVGLVVVHELGLRLFARVRLELGQEKTQKAGSLVLTLIDFF